MIGKKVSMPEDVKEAYTEIGIIRIPKYLSFFNLNKVLCKYRDLKLKKAPKNFFEAFKF